MDCGVLYCGIDPPYLEQARDSARSMKDHNDVDVGIITSAETNDEALREFDDVIRVEQPFHDVRDKSYHLDQSPYQKTLYLDGDTTILGDITPVFEVLENVDIAVTLSTTKLLLDMKDVPEAFPAVNTGVIAYNNTKAVEDLLDRWGTYYSRQVEQGRPHDSIPIEDGASLDEVKTFGRKTDQPPLREALFDSNIRFSILPDEYNFSAWGRSYAYSDVKILHGKASRRRRLDGVVNRFSGKRVYLDARIGKIYHKNGAVQSVYPLHQRLIYSILRYTPTEEVLKKSGLYKIARNIFHRTRGQE